jgi:hypothetical protein
MPIESFNNTIDQWISSLHRYNLKQLLAKPSPTSWSLGQLYNHVINETSYYISRMDICISSNRNAGKEMTAEGKAMFRNNSFPNERLIGAPSHSRISQPLNKHALVVPFMDLKKNMNARAALMKKSAFHGKSKHPGLNYFTASEWLQFADMHMRHHLRQKKRLDDYLRSSY